MFRTILVPLDGSCFAEQAIPWALAIARRAGASLDLVRNHVLYALKERACSWLPYNRACDAEARKQEQLYLDATACWLAAVSPVPIQAALVEGLAADGILQRLTRDQGDLVVMATHARGPVNRLIHGSVADQIVREASVPVLLVPAADSAPAPRLLPEPSVANVVVALDGSTLAEQALEPALDLTRLLECPCTLLRVIAPRNVQPDPLGGYVKLLPDELEAEAWDYLAKLAEPLLASGVEVQTRVVAAGHAAPAILEEAQALGGAVIALATHGRGGLRRMLLGSVADQVVRAAACPVLVYRPAVPAPVTAGVTWSEQPQGPWPAMEEDPGRTAGVCGGDADRRRNSVFFRS
jgi:nucleotide-binding universal stress UspA family protein